MLRILRVTSAIQRLAVARVISVAGSRAAFVALNYVVYQRTRSATWLAATLLLTFGTVAVASPIGGAVGDRFDRKRGRSAPIWQRQRPSP